MLQLRVWLVMFLTVATPIGDRPFYMLTEDWCEQVDVVAALNAAVAGVTWVCHKALIEPMPP